MVSVVHWLVRLNISSILLRVYGILVVINDNQRYENNCACISLLETFNNYCVIKLAYPFPMVSRYVYQIMMAATRFLQGYVLLSGLWNVSNYY